jgi:tetratricopeptide (TPR) repeat protein
VRLFALVPFLLAGNKGTPKPHALVITANVPGANVFEDGMVVGKSGEPFDTAPGPHAVVVLANGYASRLVNVKVDPRNPKTMRSVTLLPSPRKVEIDYTKARRIVPKAPLASLPSLCAQFNAAAPKLPAGLLAPCHRKTVLDDLAFFGLGELRSGPNDGSLRADLTAKIGQAGSEDFYWRAEDLFAQAPNDEAAVTILGYSALLRGNCTRISEMGLELDAAALYSPGLSIVRSFCHELAGEVPDAIAALRLDKRKAPPGAYYYAARVAYRSSLPAAEATLKSCMQQWPAYYPCAEAFAQVEALSGRNDAAAAGMRAYLATAAGVVAGVGTDAQSAAALYAAYPWIFEAAGLKLAATGGEPSALSVPLNETLIASAAGLKRLVPVFEAAHANAVLAVAYRLQLAAAPNDVTLLIKLANADRSLDKCDEAVSLGERALKLITDPARRAALTITQSECLTRLDRLDDAESLLVALLDKEPNTWKAQYNLGIVLQRQGRVDEALSHLELANVDEAPPSTRKRIADMIAFLTAKKAGKSKK